MTARLLLRSFARSLLLIVSASVHAQTSGVLTIPNVSAFLLDPGKVRIEWLAPSDGFRLERALDLNAGFQLVSEVPTLEGGDWVVALPVTSPRSFFRLRFYGLTRVAEASPANGEGGVAVTRETVLRFDTPLDPSTVLPVSRFFAEAVGRRILSRSQLSEDRRTATLFYQEPLPGAARVKVTFDANGLKDVFGSALDGDGDGLPGGIHRLSFDTLGIEPLPGAAVFGRVFASEVVAGPPGRQSVNRPLLGVTITVDGAEESLRTTTDANGNFVLPSVPAGEFFVHIDGRTSPLSTYPLGSYYPSVGKKWTGVAGQTIPAGGGGEIYLPLIQPGTLRPVSAELTTTITFPPEVIRANPALEGVSLSVPPNALYADNGTRGGMVGIAPVAPDRLPSPLPAGLMFPLVITVQTDGGQNFDQPVPVCFPNLADPVSGEILAPGSKTALWSFNHDLGNWEIVGPATISPDGKFACSDLGVGIRQPGWHGVSRGTQGATRGGGAASAIPPSPCDWNALAKFFGDRYEQQKNTANGALALQLKCIGEKACQNQSTWGGGFIKSVMCAEKMNPNGAQPGLIPGLSIFPIGQALDAICRNVPVPESGNPIVDANIKLLLNEICAPLSGFLHHFINELLPYFALFCDQLTDEDHDALFEQGVLPCFNELTLDTRLNDVLAEIGSVLVPAFAGLLREITQATCFLGGRAAGPGLAEGTVPPPLAFPPMPDRSRLYVPKLGSLGTLRVTAEPANAFFLQVGQTYALSVILNQPDGSLAQLAANPGTRYHVYGDQNLLEISTTGQMSVKAAHGPLPGIPTPMYVLALNGTNFGIGQFVLTDVDSDGDGLTDSTEIRLNLDPRTSNDGKDSDSDGVSDLREALMGTDPRKFDTDGDGIEDGRELQFGMNPRNASLESAPFQALLQRYLLEDLDTGTVQRGLTSSQGVLQELILASGRTYRLTILIPSTLFLGSVEFTSAEPGFVTQIPRVVAAPPEGSDLDGDGLEDRAENVMGSDIRKPDSDGDGVSDAAEVVQGTNPTGVDQPANGVLQVVGIPAGVAEDVDAFGNVVVVAQGGGGIAVLNAFRGMAPTSIAQVNTAGEAQDIAIAGDYVVAADGSSGLAYFRLSELPDLTLAHRVPISGNCIAVALAANHAYAGLADGRVVNVDLVSGAIVDEILTDGTQIMDMAIVGDELYVLSRYLLTTLSLLEGRLELLGSTPHSLAVGAGGNRLRLHAAEDSLIASQTYGYQVFDLTTPAQPVFREERRYNEFGWRQFVPDGFGLGLAVVGSSSLNDSPHDLATYALGLPLAQDNLVQILTLGREFRAATIYGGQGYAVDDSRRLVVVKYRDFDRRTNAPSVTLSVPFSDLGASAGLPGRVTAVVSDDVAVRQVEFYVNDVLQAIDGNFPFEHRFVVEGRASDRSELTLRAKAIDTAGNVGWSELLRIPVAADASAPRVLKLTPADGAQLGIRRFGGISAVFDDALDRNSIDDQAIGLFTRGNDAQWGTADDERVSGTRVELVSDGRTVVLTTLSPLPAGEYRVVIAPTVANQVGLKLDAERSSVFTIRPDVVWIRDADGRWDDGSNWSSGTPPGADDSVFINRPGVDITVTLDGPFSFSSPITFIDCNETLAINPGRALQIATASRIRKLRLTGGALDGDGSVSLVESVEWETGTIGRLNSVTVEPGALVSISGPGQHNLQARSLLIGGRMLVNAPLYQESTPISVLPGGELEVGDLGEFPYLSPFRQQNAVILNGGLVRKTGTNRLDLTQVDLLNDSLVQVVGGQLTVGAGRTTGEFRAEAESRIVFFLAGEQLLAPTLRFTGQGSTMLLGGRFRVLADLRLPRLEFAGGTFVGTGRVVVEGSLEWAGGTFACDGGLRVEPGAVAEVASSSITFGLGAAMDGGILDNHGTVKLNGRLFAVNGAVIENQPGAVFELLADVGVVDPTGSGGGDTQLAGIPGAPPSFSNRGTLRKIAGTDESVFERVTLLNSGLIDLRQGVLALRASRGGGIDVQSISARRPSLSGPALSGVGESGFTQTASGILRLHLNGDVPGAGYSVLRVEETATLAGSLVIEVASETPLMPGQTFNVLEFGAVVGDFQAFEVSEELPDSLLIERTLLGTGLRLELKAKP